MTGETNDLEMVAQMEQFRRDIRHAKNVRGEQDATLAGVNPEELTMSCIGVWFDYKKLHADFESVLIKVKNGDDSSLDEILIRAENLTKKVNQIKPANESEDYFANWMRNRLGVVIGYAETSNSPQEVQEALDDITKEKNELFGK